MGALGAQGKGESGVRAGAAAPTLPCACLRTREDRIDEESKEWRGLSAKERDWLRREKEKEGLCAKDCVNFVFSAKNCFFIQKL